MAHAQQAGGLYYIGETAVDANGTAIEGAPARQQDTDPSKQPGALGQQTPEEKLATAIATALGRPASASPADHDELPTLGTLESHLEGLSAKDVRAMQARDERKGAVPLYEARLAALGGA